MSHLRNAKGCYGGVDADRIDADLGPCRCRCRPMPTTTTTADYDYDHLPAIHRRRLYSTQNNAFHLIGMEESRVAVAGSRRGKLHAMMITMISHEDGNHPINDANYLHRENVALITSLMASRARRGTVEAIWINVIPITMASRRRVS